ncbi:MAG: hypothetical protein SFU98_01755 [Leptospiraceae bacterium]|nr:hypothetical protein [Leptospiraceae bacterium]
MSIRFIHTKNNSSMLDELFKLQDSYVSAKEFRLLTDVQFIFTREKVTSEYLLLKLAEKNLPSLSYDVSPFHSNLLKFFPNTNKEFLSSLSAKYLLKEILLKEDSSLTPRKAFKLASQIYKHWDRLLQDFSTIPKKYQYYKVLIEFIKSKKNVTQNEFLKNSIEKKLWRDPKELKNEFGKRIIFYGLKNINEINFKIVQFLEEHFEIVVILRPLELISEFYTIENFLDTDDIAYKFRVEIEEQESKLTDYTKPVIISAPEVHREIEFVATNILEKLNNAEGKFYLNEIKLIIPDSTDYYLATLNVFQRYGIPVSFTRVISDKIISPYYTAFQSIIRIFESRFSVEEVFHLFHNPCFSPEFEAGLTESINSDIWQRIVVKAETIGFLDKEDRLREKVRAEDFKTWNSLWDLISRNLSHTEEKELFAKDLYDDALQFLKVSSYFLNDLIYLKENEFPCKEFISFFRVFLDTYLSPNLRKQKDSVERLEKLNMDVKRSIYNLLFEIEKMQESNFKDKKFTFEDLVNIFNEELDFTVIASPRVLKSGVTVGTFEDTTDPVFEYVYAVGISESRIPEQVTNLNQYIFTEHSAENIKKRSIQNFYGIWNHNPKQIFLSYVRIDSLGDKKSYPSPELKKIAEKFGVEEIQIPLWKENSEVDKFYVTEWEKAELELKLLAKQEIVFQTIQPTWENANSLAKNEMEEFVQNQKSAPKNLVEQFFRPVTIQNSNQNISNTIDLNSFARFLECPQKFHFDSVLNLQEEEEVSEEIYSISPILETNLYRTFLESYFENPDSFQDRISDILIEENEKSFPRGILGSLEKERITEQMTKVLGNFFREEFYGFKFFSKIEFSSLPFRITQKELMISGIKFLGRELQSKTTSLIYNKEKNELGFLISRRTKLNLSTQLKAILFTNLLYEEELKSIYSKELQMENPQIKLYFLQFMDKNNEPKLQVADTHQFPKNESFLPFLELFESNSYPISPLDFTTKNQNTCEYCKIQKFCFGYENEFENVLVQEREELFDLIQTINFKATQKQAPI